MAREGNSTCGPQYRHDMATSKEYREYADECFGWAKTAKSDRERDIFLQTARTWLEAAIRAERREGQNHPKLTSGSD